METVVWEAVVGEAVVWEAVWKDSNVVIISFAVNQGQEILLFVGADTST